ncbi:HYR domain-containing protein [Algoriphagus sp. D3-2-R+10]|uniref:HYR domain-containing protein n=1 Tax=Algoriphagus aurantiacus TaxID=3103948 RepID=UPI002B3C145F|nr:HYR domain-containing protein [Algoriphagus sp. D3-2-R+10]MEB2777926.1 HYR domain-containing protein [Algoriphagus sp. D3-2-R+10]
MKLSYSRQIFLFIFVSIAWSLQSFGQQTTVNFDSYTENQGLSNPHVEGELRFEAIKGASATCTVCVGIDINEGNNGGPGLDDSNQEIGGIIGWKISQADDASFQFLSIWLQDRDISNTLGTSDVGTIKAFKGGAQVGNTKAINFDSGTSGLKSFATDPDFFDVDHILIEGVDLFLILDDVTYNVPFVDGNDTPPTVLAVNLIGAPLSTATSVTYNVEFSKIAENVTADDFELTKTGSAIGTIGAVSGSNATYSVLVTGLSGEGTIRLDIKAGTDISNENNVTGTAAFTSGQIHNVSPCLIEDFEDETDASNTFSHGGNNFSITGNLEVHTETPPIGINGSRYVLLNTGTGPYVINSLSRDINLKKFAVYLSSDADGNNPTNDGSITVVGKNDGAQVYSITKSSGFPEDFSANSGYYIFDLRTEGGVDNSSVFIDQLEISLGSAFQYLNIDNFEFCLDAIDPVISDCPTDIIVSNGEGSCGAAVTWTAPTATDNSGSVNFISNIAPGTVFEVGTTMVTYTATDGAGNQATCSFTVTVNDTEAPIITCPASVSETVAFGETGKVINYATPTFSDNCTGAIIERTAGLASGSTFPVGPTTVTYNVKDASGNVVECSFTVTITENADLINPVISNCPSNILVSNDSGTCGAAVSWTPPLATDNGGSVTLNSNFEPGDNFPVGTTIVIYTAIDGAGNQATCTFEVKVIDDTPPVPPASPGDLNIRCASDIPVPYELTAIDNCDGEITVLPSVTQSSTGPNSYTITYEWAFIDAVGNAVFVSQRINVSDNVSLSIDASESGNPVPVGSDATLSAMVTPATEGVEVTFLLDGVFKGTALSDASGLATLMVLAAELGSLPVVYKVSAIVEGCTGLVESVAYLPIYDPNGNFVTGGGWIMSPAGAYKADESLTGKANFGFVSKYKKGSNQVDGNTEFEFHAGDLYFKSTFHESGSLVISGKKATYRGEGMINDVPGYKFTLVALDGDWNGGTDPDQFRIKIWGASGIVYDNGLGADDNSDASTILGGGSITIHSAKGKGNKRVITDPTSEVLNNLSEEIGLKFSQELKPGEFLLYPNPAHTETSVMVDLDQGATVAIRIYDAVGRLVVDNEAYREVSFVQTFSLDGLAPGFYNVQVKVGDIMMTRRLIKQ